MKTQIKERQKKPRVAEEIVIALIKCLRESPDGLTRYGLMGMAGVNNKNTPLFIEYMAGRGLIQPAADGMPIELTDNGQNISLEPEEFSDFKYVGKKRSRFGIQRDIRRVVHGHDGASLTDIVIGASLSWNTACKYVAELQGRNELTMTPDGRYQLADAGLSKIQDDKCLPIIRIKMPVSSGVGETLTRILEDAHKGGKRSMRELAPTLTSRNMGDFIRVLFQYDLLGGSNGEFCTTTLYEEMDKNALLYALEILVGHNLSKKKSGSIVEWNALQALMYSPGHIAYLKRILKGDRFAYKKHLAILEGKGYVSSFQQGRATLYQITPLGKDLVGRVNNYIEQLRLHAV